MTCCFVAGLSVCASLLGGSITAYAEENGEIAIGEAWAVEEGADDSQQNGFADEAQTVDAGGSITFTGTYDYSQAYEILDLVNAERRAQGLNELVMDRELLDAAMLRAAEIAVLFDHTRPDGTRCFTVSDKCFGENIAVNYSVKGVMNSWMGSSGHRNNILGSSKSIGIGCFTQGGHVYYVQCFGGATTDVATKPANKVAPRTVYISSAYMEKADIYTSGGVTYFTNLDWGNAKIKLDTEDKKVEIPVYEDTQTVFPATNATVKYRTHIQSYGWSGTAGNTSDWESDGQISGTIDLDRRMEGIEIIVDGAPGEDLGVKYRTHVQTYGWSLGWVTEGNMSGTEGQAKRVEAIQIELTGADADKYDIYYRVNTEDYGWLGWAKDGAMAGTSGQGKRLEAIQITVVPTGEKPSGLIGYSYVEYAKIANNSDSSGLINYMTHVQTYGDQSYVHDGSISGTFGESKRLEAIRIKLNNDKIGLSGGVKYTTHVQTYGWQGDPYDSSSGWVMDGDKSGTSGQSKRLEAICIELYGEVAQYYDVYYRVHAQTFGWLDWAKNGEPAGTAGYSKRLEGIQIVLVPKNVTSPFGAGGHCFVNAY